MHISSSSVKIHNSMKMFPRNKNLHEYALINFDSEINEAVLS